MTIRYVGPGGSDSNSGLTWELRKLTLNGVEDTPVVAGDIIYVAPGVYREALVIDTVHGTVVSPITYIGDVTGEHTDGVGGIVRITGSDNDQTPARAYAIGVWRNYRYFKGFSIDGVSGNSIYSTGNFSNCIFEDMTFVSAGVVRNNQASLSNIYRRCIFLSSGIYFLDTTDRVSNCLVENCLFISILGNAITIEHQSEITIKNCSFIGCTNGIYIAQSLAASATDYVNNCIFVACSLALRATTSGEITEDYNSFYSNTTNRTNVATGSNSNTYIPLFNPPLLQDGFRLPWQIGELSKWSQLSRIVGTGESTDDVFGMIRPITSAKKSRGAIQYTGATRENLITFDNSISSIKLPDAGEQLLVRVPIRESINTIISTMVYREENYAGTNPQIIIRQAGQNDITITDTASSQTWNSLSITFVPSAIPSWLDIIAVSNNTATSGSYGVFFDHISVY